MPTVSSLGAQDGRLSIAGLAREPVPWLFEIEARVAGAAARLLPLNTPGPAGCFRAGPFELEPRQRRVGDAIELGWRLVNVSDEPVLLDAVQLEAPGAGWPLLREPGRLRMYQHGYQSWTPSGSVAGDSRPVYPLLGSFALMNHFVDSALWGRKDGLISSLLTVLCADGDTEGTLLGFTTQRVGLGELFYRNRGTPALLARLDYGGKRIGPGECVEGEWLRIARGPVDGLLQDWAAATAAQMQARVPDVSPVGWCSWYQYYTGVTAQDLRSNTDFLAEHPELGVGFVQLDDGYQPHVGDWLELNDKFPDGLAHSTQHIREQGFEAGIWTAPFFASAGSRHFAEHPEWFLRRRGRPVATGFNPEWRARTFALDLTHPALLAWLTSVFEHLVEQGFDYHKIDFLFAGLRHGESHDPGLSPVEAYRQGLATIRAAIGPERFLLGCGAPIGPSVGFVDGMRISQDVKEQWDSRLAGWVGRGCGYPAARGALRTNMTRWFTHRSLWVNDPDCLLVREHDTKLTHAETITLLSVLGATGGMLFLSDDLPRVSEERLALAAAVLPPSRLVGRPSCTMTSGYPADITVHGGAGERLVVLVNWEATAVHRAVPDTPVEGTWFDFWKGALVAEHSVGLPPHGVRALRFVPSTETPCIVGDTFNLLAGVDGRLSSHFDEASGVLNVSCVDVARSVGRLLLSLPAGLRLDLDVLPAGVSLCESRSDGALIEVRRPAPWTLELRSERS